MKHILVSLFIILICSIQLHSQFGSQDSGGPLTPEWAAYDVKFYNINLNINPDKETINGWVGVTAEAVINVKDFVLDLDDRYRITKIVCPPEAGKDRTTFDSGLVPVVGKKEVPSVCRVTITVFNVNHTSIDLAYMVPKDTSRYELRNTTGTCTRVKGRISPTRFS